MPDAADWRVGTAGWSVATAEAQHFPAEGTSLERYSARFGCAEINSSFHRSHRPATYQRWAASVPDGFRFSAKLAKTITHKCKLEQCDALIRDFLEEVGGLGDKLSILLVQLPPSLAYDRSVAESFFRSLRGRTDLRIACEPRHASWFEAEADALLDAFQVARVAADPARVPAAASPGGWRGFAYYRLHGSPVIYRSSYDDGRLDGYAREIAREGEAWCIFDNTASSAATGNALGLQRRLAGIARTRS